MSLPLIAASAALAWLYIDVDQGIFEKCGLKADTGLMSAQTQVSTYLAGQTSLRITGGGFPAAVAAVQRPEGIYGLLALKPVFYMLGGPSVSSAADLKGKTIAVLSPVDSTYKLALIFLKEHNLKPTDVHFSYVSKLTSIYAALNSGAAQGAILDPPYVELAEARGAKMIEDFSKDNGVEIPSEPIMSDPAWVSSHKELALSIMRAIMAGVWIAQSKPDVLRASLIKHLKIDTSTKDGQITLDASVKLAQGVYLPVEKILSMDPAWADLFKTQAPPNLQDKLKDVDMKSFVHTDLGQTLLDQGIVKQLQSVYGPIAGAGTAASASAAQ